MAKVIGFPYTACAAKGCDKRVVRRDRKSPDAAYCSYGCAVKGQPKHTARHMGAVAGERA